MTTFDNMLVYVHRFTHGEHTKSMIVNRNILDTVQYLIEKTKLVLDPKLDIRYRGSFREQLLNSKNVFSSIDTVNAYKAIVNASIKSLTDKCNVIISSEKIGIKIYLKPINFTPEFYIEELNDINQFLNHLSIGFSISYNSSYIKPVVYEFYEETDIMQLSMYRHSKYDGESKSYHKIWLQHAEHEKNYTYNQFNWPILIIHTIVKFIYDINDLHLDGKTIVKITTDELSRDKIRSLIENWEYCAKYKFYSIITLITNHTGDKPIVFKNCCTERSIIQLTIPPEVKKEFMDNLKIFHDILEAYTYGSHEIKEIDINEEQMKVIKDILPRPPVLNWID